MLNLAQQQIKESLILLKNLLKQDLLGVYLFGSALIGGLQKYSDLDLFVVSNRPTTLEEKRKLVESLLKISGIYMKSAKPPIEMTIVVKSAVNPWQYPPQIDFQYGEWLRESFEFGNIEPWHSKDMPELALIITQILLSSKTLLGEEPKKILAKVPYSDCIKAMDNGLSELMNNLETDTRNVLLTLARMWVTLETDGICSKPVAADWVISHLPKEYQLVLQRAKGICIGVENEHWDDINTLIKPCADFIFNQVKEKIAYQLLNPINKAIKIIK